MLEVTKERDKDGSIVVRARARLVRRVGRDAISAVKARGGA